MCKAKQLIPTNKKRHFIAGQVVAIEKCCNAVTALQFQRDRIRKYKTLIDGIDTGEITDTTFNISSLRDNAIMCHDRHVSIYRFILDYYASFLAGMIEQVIAHTSGAPVEHNSANSLPFIQQLQKTA